MRTDQKSVRILFPYQYQCAYYVKNRNDLQSVMYFADFYAVGSLFLYCDYTGYARKHYARTAEKSACKTDYDCSRKHHYAKQQKKQKVYHINRNGCKLHYAPYSDSGSGIAV